jgi:type II secretory pathway pseudopilin PulG
MYCAQCGKEVETLATDCPSCGMPASGAPAQLKKKTPAVMLVAIILGVAMVAVTIFGIIAAIAIPSFLNGLHRGRQKRTVADMHTIAMAVGHYSEDHGFFPRADSIEELASQLEPKYAKDLPRADGWENSLKYLCWQTDPNREGCDNFVLASPARDRVFEHPDLKVYIAKTARTHYFDCDIVYSNGTFVQSPEGL